jgi:Uma2 family endonuclease
VVEVGFVLEHDPDTVRAPDVAFVTAARVPDATSRGKYFDGAPDLAVEVVSPGDTAAEVLEKVQEYLAAGCQMVWVIESKTRTVVSYRPDGSAKVLREDDQLSGEDVLPGFSVPVRRVFAR